MHNDVRISKNDICYQIRYDNQDDSMTIRATHDDGSLRWFTKITTNLSDPTIKFQKIFSPKNIYNLLKAYILGDLSRDYRIDFPTKYEAHESLIIAVNHCEYYGSSYETLLILTLQSESSSLEIVQSQLAQKNAQIDALTKRVDDLEKSVVSLLIASGRHFECEHFES